MHVCINLYECLSKALKKLRNSDDIEDDIAEMKAEEIAQRTESKITMFELLRSPTLRLPLAIAVVMQLSQQLSGINAVIRRLKSIFIFVFNCTWSFEGFLLLNKSVYYYWIERISCKICYYRNWSSNGYNDFNFNSIDGSKWKKNFAFIRTWWHVYFLYFHYYIFLSKGKKCSTICKTITVNVVFFQEIVAWIWWLSVVSTLFYVVFFAVGPGSIPWMITAELFSQGPRPAAMSVAVLINWCANFLVGIGFPTMQVIFYYLQSW